MFGVILVLDSIALLAIGLFTFIQKNKTHTLRYEGGYNNEIFDDIDI
jgi:uncharacterized protein YkuJ